MDRHSGVASKPAFVFCHTDKNKKKNPRDTGIKFISHLQTSIDSTGDTATSSFPCNKGSLRDEVTGNNEDSLYATNWNVTESFW